ncbi:MAG: 2OG-Fe(II) oxygenase [Alphaproteobacteria bacterium]
MSEATLPPIPTFVVWDDAFTAQELATITALGDALTAETATIKSGDPNDAVRDEIRITKTAWIAPSPQSSWLYDRIQRVARALNDRSYQFDLRGFSENMQYTIYHGAEGGHYGWHVDHGPLKVQRKFSISVQLSDPDDYDGCDLEFQAGNKIETAPRTKGAIVGFPSYVLHRVTPCTRGTRKALVAWTTGPKLR